MCIYKYIKNLTTPVPLRGLGSHAPLILIGTTCDTSRHLVNEHTSLNKRHLVNDTTSPPAQCNCD